MQHERQPAWRRIHGRGWILQSEPPSTVAVRATAPCGPHRKPYLIDVYRNGELVASDLADDWRQAGRRLLARVTGAAS